MTLIPNDLQVALGTLDAVQQARLGRMLSTLGEARMRHLVTEAQAIQAQGGMTKPTGEPRSTMGIVGVLVRESTRPADQAAIFGPNTFVSLDTGLLGAVLPIAKQLSAMTYPQQQTLAAMYTVLGPDRLQSFVDQALQHAATGGLVASRGQPLTSTRAILWRLVSANTTPEEAAAIFAQPLHVTLDEHILGPDLLPVAEQLAPLTEQQQRVLARMYAVLGADRFLVFLRVARQRLVTGGMVLPSGQRLTMLRPILWRVVSVNTTSQETAAIFQDPAMVMTLGAPAATDPAS